MKLSVLVPTHRRVADLRRCLAALEAQRCRPDQVVLVIRSDDEETRALLRDYRRDALVLDQVEVDEPGQVAALNAGLRRCHGDVLAIIDDDTAPWPDWLERIEQHFSRSPRLGGLGGRDMICAREVAPQEETHRVCRVSWYGHWIGQAHRGVGPAREVELLKGCNMSYRREAIAGVWFDSRLKGNGAQWFNDSAFSLSVKRGGWQVVYDPSVRVDHYLGRRDAGDERWIRTPEEIYEAVYNETLVLLEYLSPLRRPVFLIFGLLIGTRRAPGLAQWLRSTIGGARHGPDLQLAAWRGRLDAWRDSIRSGRSPSPWAGGGDSPRLIPE